jgi:hypothetical protein
MSQDFTEQLTLKDFKEFKRITGKPMSVALSPKTTPLMDSDGNVVRNEDGTVATVEVSQPDFEDLMVVAYLLKRKEDPSVTYESFEEVTTMADIQNVFGADDPKDES